MMSTVCASPEQLIEDCQGLVHSLAAKVHRRLPPHLDLDDLVGYGQIGLAEAARDFDPTRGTSFSTYAYYRIRGAIYDGLSKMSWLSRAEYKRVRYEQMAGEVLKLESEDVAVSFDATIEEDWRWLRDVSRALAVVYLTTHGDEEHGGQAGQAEPADRSTPGPQSAVMDRELTGKLKELIEALPSEAGVLIRAVYYEGLTLQQAGQRLGVSKSWASRLHAKTLQRLARSLKILGLAL
jgi:RNA polymerase sigma factor for flagellar operon FliA